jgi:hypothetical protein
MSNACEIYHLEFRPFDRLGISGEGSDEAKAKPGSSASRFKKFKRVLDLLNDDLDVLFKSDLDIVDVHFIFGSSLVSVKEIYVCFCI